MTDSVFPFQQSAHDRLEHRRSDTTWWEGVRRDPATRVLVASGTSLAACDDHLTVVSPDDAPDGEWLLLGEVEGHTYVVVMTPETPDDDRFRGLRRLALSLGPVEASLAVHATALIAWHRKHPRCSMCGAPTEITMAGAHRHCPACDTPHFPRTDPAVIMLIEDSAGRALLARHARTRARADQWYTTLAGFVEPGESLEDAVRREVAEETSVQVGEVAYLGSQPWPFPSSLMLGFRGRAMTTDIVIDQAEIREARWFTRDELRTEIEQGRLSVPAPISISHALIRDWFGAELPQAQP